MRLFFLLFLLIPSLSWGDKLGELNSLLVNFENKIDTCLEVDDDNEQCVLDISTQYLIDVMGNTEFTKLLASGKCEIGTECGASISRITGKMLTLELEIFETMFSEE